MYKITKLYIQGCAIYIKKISVSFAISGFTVCDWNRNGHLLDKEFVLKSLLAHFSLFVSRCKLVSFIYIILNCKHI